MSVFKSISTLTEFSPRVPVETSETPWYPPTRRVVELCVSQSLIVDMCKATDNPRFYKVTKNPIPDDVRVMRAGYDIQRDCLVFLLESETFDLVDPGVVPPTLDAPWFSLVTLNEGGEA